VINRTRGSVSYEASMTVYGSGWNKLIRNLSAVALTQGAIRGSTSLISLVHFNIHVMYTPPGSLNILQYKLKGCRLLGRTFNATEGSDAQQIEVPLSVIEIVDVVDGRDVVMV
jgi:hypothetical protein